jgi:hypothetical protein
MTRIDHSLRPSLVLPDAEPGSPAAAAEGCLAVDLSAALDAQTVAYVLAARPHFDGLKKAAGQLAGLLVLAATGARSITQEHAMLKAAADAHAEATDGLATAHAPARAAHHHLHLTEAARTIGAALAVAAEQMHGFAAGRREVDAALRPLKLGYRHLQWAAGALPGFEIVSFQQACCAGHSAKAPGS